jgi:hypothetical protein
MTTPWRQREETEIVAKRYGENRPIDYARDFMRRVKTAGLDGV